MTMDRHSTITKRNSPGSSESAEKRLRESFTADFLRPKLTANQEAKREVRQQVANIAQIFQNFLQVQSEQINQIQQQSLLILQ